MYKQYIQEIKSEIVIIQLEVFKNNDFHIREILLFFLNFYFSENVSIISMSFYAINLKCKSLKTSNQQIKL